jgi:hypothetical protein
MGVLLKTLGKCSGFRAKPAHMMAVAHFGYSLEKGIL